jgi:hypothetical protein
MIAAALRTERHRAADDQGGCPWRQHPANAVVTATNTRQSSTDHGCGNPG